MDGINLHGLDIAEHQIQCLFRKLDLRNRGITLRQLVHAQHVGFITIVEHDDRFFCGIFSQQRATQQLSLLRIPIQINPGAAFQGGSLSQLQFGYNRKLILEFLNIALIRAVVIHLVIDANQCIATTGWISCGIIPSAVRQLVNHAVQTSAQYEYSAIVGCILIFQCYKGFTGIFAYEDSADHAQHICVAAVPHQIRFFHRIRSYCIGHPHIISGAHQYQLRQLHCDIPATQPPQQHSADQEQQKQQDTNKLSLAALLVLLLDNHRFGIIRFFRTAAPGRSAVHVFGRDQNNICISQKQLQLFPELRGALISFRGIVCTGLQHHAGEPVIAVSGGRHFLAADAHCFRPLAIHVTDRRRIRRKERRPVVVKQAVQHDTQGI